MQAKRTPVLKVLRKAINVVTSGKFEKNNNFDDLYHLALICQLENGVSIVIEKNETIKISRSYKMTKDTETIDIPMNNVSMTVNELLDNCLKNIGSEDFYLYDAIRGRNCQDFIINLLKSSKLGNNNNYKWIKQDLSKVDKNLSHTEKTVLTGITSLGANIAHSKVGDILGLGKRRAIKK